MKKIIILLMLVANTSFFAQQKTLTVSGKVIEKSSSFPLEFATVTFVNPTESKDEAGTMTDAKGNFSLKISPGKYTLKTAFIGLKTSTIENINVQSNQTLPTISLEAETTQLKTVEIKTEKSTIEYKLDKKVFNVGNDILSKGGTASDILNNVPSVSVSTDGAVSLRGNTGVRILINGKPSVLTANNGLDQIPSESIEKVEVITNPSAKYDSGGTAGIINIVLKKNKISGFGSSAQVTAGVPTNSGLGYNVSYKNKKMNLFSDLQYQQRNRIRRESSLRTNYANNLVDSYLNGTIDRDRNNKTFNIYLGGDYYFNDKNTLTMSYYFRKNTTTNTADYLFNYLDVNQNTTQKLMASEKYREPQIANQMEANYVKTFGKEGKKWTTNIQYNFWNDDENEYIVEQEKLPIPLPPTTLKSRNLESSKDLLLQTDYTIPLKEKSKIEFGLKAEIRKMNSDYQVYENTILIDSLNNTLHYKEQIIGAYIQFGSSIKKLQYLAGLRTENSNTGSNDKINPATIQKKYTDFFPTLHLSYGFNALFNLQLSYSRRIERPDFWQINSFGGIADRRNIRIGNPNLNPSYTDSYEINTIIKWKQLSINPSLYHQFSKNIFQQIRIPNTNGYLVEQTINSGTESRIGTEMNITYTPLKWLTLTGEMNYYTFTQKGVFNLSDDAFTSKMNARIKSSSWNIEPSINHEGANNNGQVYSKQQCWVDFGIAKDIWNEKVTITFKVDNVFNSRISRETITGTNYTLNTYFNNVGPRFYATFTYRFNRKKADNERLPE